MSISDDLSFGHEDRRRIYEYVESKGTVHPDEARSELRVDPGGFRHHAAILKRDGLLETDDGLLRVAFDAGEAEEHRGDDLTFEIRPARQEDLTGIVGAIRQVARDGRYIEAETVAQEVDHDEALLRHNELESRVFFVATVEGDAVGWLHVEALKYPRMDHTAELTVGVLEEYRGGGLGTALLDRGLDWAAANGFERVYNEVPATNTEAIAFLEDHGWEIEARRDDHYKMDGEYVDDVLMDVEL